MATNLNNKLHNVLGEICMAESDAKERDEYTLAETLAKAGDHVIEAIRLIETLAREAEALRWDAIESVMPFNKHSDVTPPIASCDYLDLIDTQKGAMS